MNSIYERLTTLLVDGMECCLIVNERPINDPATLDSKSRIIYLEKSLPIVNKTVALAHEMGHLLDLDERCKGNWDKYQGEYISHPLQGEVFAWLNAIVILRNEGFENWSVVINDVERYISTYVESEKHIKYKPIVVNKILDIVNRKIE